MDIRLESRIAALVSRALSTAAVCAGLHVAAATLQAQSIAVGYASAPAGSWVDVDVTFTAGGTAVSALQFDLSFSSSLTYSSVQTGAAAAAAGKSASGNQIAGGARILVYGINQNAIGTGTLAIIRFTSLKTATPGILSLTVVPPVIAADPNAQPVACASSDGSVTLLSADNTIPIVTVTSPPEATGETPLLLSGTASDNYLVDTVSWTVNGGGSTDATGTTLPWASTAWSASIPLVAGVNTIVISAVDTSGNLGTVTIYVTFTGAKKRRGQLISS